ncbi:MAG: DUF1549 domain-containing protein, partial [Isosphaeraceae bacterium]|nr:DUF1549 domain-containing protein [Isosphaeraceae bacterium]
MSPNATRNVSTHKTRRRVLCDLFVIAGLVVSLRAGLLADEPRDAKNPADLEFFEREVRPILSARCQKCHGGEAQKGGLRLDSRSSVIEGGSTGPAVVPGKPEESLLVDAINYGDTYQMPPRSKLPEKEIASLTRWVERGAPWPVEQGAKPAGAGETFNLKERARHWSFQPLRAPALPTVKNSAWPATPADRFLLAKLETQGLQPAPDTDKRTWLRRVNFDLIGLPPSREELASFLADASPDAFATVVDRLLASPHFGERWGRHWLDLVRYAETRGHEFDYTAPNAREYRDYVVRALNADVPYDQFVTEHVAGDLLSPPRRHAVEGFNESVLGTGFWFLGEQVHSPVDIRQDEADRFDNMVDVMSKTFLGLTVACARSHDHKFDAISTKDYYALLGFLQSSTYRFARFDSADQNRQVAADLAGLRARHRRALQQDLARELRSAIEGLDDRQLNDRLHPFERIATGPKQAGLPDWAEVVLDFGRLGPNDWMPDDVGFGLGPQRAADPIFGENSASPITGIETRGTARYERAWDRLSLAPGAENDPGRLGEVMRAGRTLRTPTFALRPGKLYYLVQGKGHAYAAVDSHAMIAGPLHGQLVLPIDAGEEPRWVAHDLSAYTGHRTHVEFTATPGSNFAVSLIVRADREPPVPGPVAPQPSGGDPARANRALVMRVAEALDRDKLAEAPSLLPLADWLVRHPEAFGRDGGWWAGSSAARDFGAAQAHLLATVRRASRLAVTMGDGSPEDESVFIRGSHKTLGPVVPRR